MQKSFVVLAALIVAAPAHAQPKARAVLDVYKAGFKDCAAAMETFVQHVHENDAEYSYVIKYALEKTNESSATALTIQNFDDGQGVASISATKTVTGKCDVVLTHTLAIPEQTCDELRTTMLKDWKLFLQANQSNIYQEPDNPNHHAILSPLGAKGCLVVKNAMGYAL